ncbi:MAG: enoyl-ACP reductase [Chloroflexota bacterium]|nr:enoyl-ACP reductase [Chloroflexota bacterium]
MYPIDLSGKRGVVFGVANQRSIAWAIAQALHQAGARLAFAYQNERFKESVQKLTEPLGQPPARTGGQPPLLECDVTDDAAVARVFDQLRERFGGLDIVVHSIAYAQREHLGGRFSDVDRQGFRTAMEISAYSLVPIARRASELMTEGGSILAMTFLAAERVFPGYNIMGTAKAALENEVGQLAAELGQQKIRVNAISAGPLDTLAARGIKGFLDMKHVYEERSPLRRNITHEEVAKAALFLLSDMSSGVTGEVLHVDAGYHIIAL